MIRNIVFDIGNVLTDYRWREFLTEKGFSEPLVERLARASVLSGQWCEYDRGVWSDERILDSFVENDPGIENELRSAYGSFEGLVTKREYAIPWLREWKEKGFGVYYLSNFSEKAFRECRDALDFLPFTDGGILSYMDKVIKPDREIYLLLLERFGLRAEECVFLDDMQANVDAAEGVGMKGIRFLNKEQAEADLKKLGVQ